MCFWSRPSSRAAHKNIQRTITIVIADTIARMIPAVIIPCILPVGAKSKNAVVFGADEQPRVALPGISPQPGRLQQPPASGADRRPVEQWTA